MASEKQVAGEVLDLLGNVIGSISGLYIDEAQQSNVTSIVKRQIQITVVDNQGNIIGSGLLEYEDYVAYGSGGVRTINITGIVEGSQLGTIEATLEDEYGSTSLFTMSNALIVLLLLWLLIELIVMIVKLTRREEK